MNYSQVELGDVQGSLPEYAKRRTQESPQQAQGYTLVRSRERSLGFCRPIYPCLPFSSLLLRPSEVTGKIPAFTFFLGKNCSFEKHT